MASLSPHLAFLDQRSTADWHCWISANKSSVVMISAADCGSSSFITLTTFSSLKQTYHMGNGIPPNGYGPKIYCPTPHLGCPLNNSSNIHKTDPRWGDLGGIPLLSKELQTLIRQGNDPILGSMVVKGKFSAAAAAPVNALNNEDLPTLGKPTIQFPCKTFLR